MKRRGNFRLTKPIIEPVPEVMVEKKDPDPEVSAGKTDLNIPKSFVGVGVMGVALIAKTAFPALPFMEYLFGTGLTIMLGGLGVKVTRMKKGGQFWKHERRLINKLRRR